MNDSRTLANDYMSRSHGALSLTLLCLPAEPGFIVYENQQMYPFGSRDRSSSIALLFASHTCKISKFFRIRCCHSLSSLANFFPTSI